LEFIALCGVRVGDVVGGGKAHSEPMKWAHINLAEKTWQIPDTKMSRPHVVPLSVPAMKVLEQMRRYRDPKSDVVFPGAKRGTVLSDATLRHMLKKMGMAGIATTHGFRSALKTWASEETSFDRDVVEAALAHAKDALASAYHRGSFLDKRRRLMAAWGKFLEGRTASEGATVLALRA
jgi:integrase